LGIQGHDDYGKDFLLTVTSIYPGYEGVPNLGDALLGAALGFIDAAVRGVLVA
jgi:hypothetical protein